MEQAWYWGLSEAIANNGSIQRAPGSGRPRTTRAAENVDAVGDLAQSHDNLLWSPYVIGQTIIFLPLLFLSSIYYLFSSPNLSGRRLDVYHTLTHGVALVRI